MAQITISLFFKFTKIIIILNMSNRTDFTDVLLQIGAIRAQAS